MAEGRETGKGRDYGTGYVAAPGGGNRHGGGREVCQQVVERACFACVGEGSSRWDIGFLLGFSFGLGAVLTCAVLSWVGGLARRVGAEIPPVSVAEEQMHECSICMHYRINCVLDPCGHQFCGMCAKKVEQCPICRKDVVRLLGTYR